MTPSPPWWRPDQFERRLVTLRARARIKQAVRQALLDLELTEVETPALQLSPGNETHVSAFATEATGLDGSRRRLFLHSSPEIACKKLLAAGLPRFFTLAPVFRNRERGRLHHPEFLMLEWYRAEEPIETLMADCMMLLRTATSAAGTHVLRNRNIEVDPFPEPEVISVTDAFRRHAGLDLDAMLPGSSGAIDRFAEATHALGLRVTPDDTWSDLFSKVLSTFVEPKLGRARPTFLTRYPATEAALARLCSDDPRFAERFELYCCGVELANAFAELRDPSEQHRRFVAAEAERDRIYGEIYPIDQEFLHAIAIMPEAVGVALGFDRLVMLATGCDAIEDVLWAPVPDTES